MSWEESWRVAPAAGNPTSPRGCVSEARKAWSSHCWVALSETAFCRKERHARGRAGAGHPVLALLVLLLA